MMNEKQLREKINNIKREIEICEELLNQQPLIDGFEKLPFGRKYSEEQILFLKENKNIPRKNLIIMFNHRFNTDIPLGSSALYNCMVREGILELGKNRGERLKKIMDNKNDN